MAGRRRPVEPGFLHSSSTTAMQSISTSNFFGHEPTTQNTRAGWSLVKYRRYTLFHSSQHAPFRVYTVPFPTLSGGDAPPLVPTFILSHTIFVCLSAAT